MKKDLTEGSQHQIDILNRSIENNQALIKEIEAMPDQEIYLSGGIFIQSGHKGYYLYGASSNNFRDLLPNYFMIWQMMLYAKAQGCTSFDFGGVSGMDDLPEEEDEAPGLYTFKKQWNANKVEKIGEFDYVLSSLWYQTYNLALNLRKTKIGILKKINR